MLCFYEKFEDKMLNENLPTVVVDTFIHYYKMLCNSTNTQISDNSIEPISKGQIPSKDTIDDFKDAGIKLLGKTAILKLNGGLGTSMGLNGPKSLLKVKDNFSFLDLSLKQLEILSQRYNKDIPLVLMNSFNTDKSTKDYLHKNNISKNVTTFIQHKFPKIIKENLKPAEWPKNKNLEWNPPGHGNLYTAIKTSGVLESLLSDGIKYLFVSNIDNTGATLDINLLGYFASLNSPFMMEVVERTAMDKKGGHLAKLKNGQLILREIAQTPQNDIESFQDITKYSYFNTNNLWIDLEYLNKKLNDTNGVLDLPMIVNEKNIDAQNKNSYKVYQLETAMGSAISIFNGSSAVEVSRKRFRPVKKCDDLLLLWSDVFSLSKDFKLEINPQMTQKNINVTLDQSFYGNVEDLTKRFPHGSPSLKNAKSLTVIGNIYFGQNIEILGDTVIEASNEEILYIPDNKKLTGKISKENL